MEWSLNQTRIFDWAEHGSGSARIEAVAGSGKTTTIIEMVTRLNGSVALAAYNKAIADEINARIKGRVSAGVKAGTFHSFGFQAWRKYAPKVKMDSRKIYDVCDAVNVPPRYQTFVMKAVGLARQWGIGALTPFEDETAWYNLVDRFDLAQGLATRDDDADPVDMDEMIEEAITLSIAALKYSCRVADTVIDFDDMIYMPVLKDVQMWQNDWVLIDEAQDTNPVRLALARKMLKVGGRLVAVGDPCQAIYGFSGADSDSLNKIAKEFNAISLPLNVSYRCPRAVVAHAQNWVSHIEAHDSAPEGSVTEVAELDFSKYTADQLRKDDAILCRYTKPLVSLALSLIRRKIGCHVEGRDIGQGLVKLARKWKRARTAVALRTQLEKWTEREVSKLMAKKQEMKAANVQDQADTLYAVMDSLASEGNVNASIDEICNAITSLFKDSESGKPADTLTLATVHRSKGREWHRVYLLGRNVHMPSKFARQDWQHEQERNLIYVAITRAKSELIEIVCE